MQNPPPQYAIWKIIVGGLLITFGISGLTFRLQLDRILSDMQAKQHHAIDGDIISAMHTIGTVGLYCGMVMVPVGLLLVLTAKKKPPPQA
jgi:hypothetical protein